MKKKKIRAYSDIFRTAKWLPLYGQGGVPDLYQCTKCHFKKSTYDQVYNYCPMCGYKTLEMTSDEISAWYDENTGELYLDRETAYWRESRPRVEIEYICSRCNRDSKKNTKYCGHCGRRMLNGR